MLTISLRSGDEFHYEESEWDEYTIWKGFFVIKKDYVAIGMFNLTQVLYILNV